MAVGCFLKFKKYILDKNQERIVYRFISHNERMLMEKHNISQMGRVWEKEFGGNSHKYKKDTKYLHFFDDINDAMILYNELGYNRDYFCTYSIPIKLLKKYKGKGYYSNRGYDIFDTVKEYAIPSVEYNQKWLLSIKTINEFLSEEHSRINNI